MDKRFENSVTGRVVSVRTVGHSKSGNPTKEVSIQLDGTDEMHTYRTMTDASLAYAIGNLEYREKSHRFGLTKAHRLNGYTEEI